MVILQTTKFSSQKFYIIPIEFVYVFLYRYQHMHDLSPHTTLHGWFLKMRRQIFTARYELSLKT
jgi:hypothetical protein